MHNFKKVIKTVLVFGLMASLLSCGIIGVFLVGENGYFQDAKAREQYAGTIDTVIIGASRAERGIIPSLVDEEMGTNSYNLAGPHLTMKGRYFLLQKEIARNPIETVIMEVSNESLTASRRGDGLEGDLYYVSRMESLGEQIRSFVSLVHPGDYSTSFVYFMKQGKKYLGSLFAGEYTTYNQTAYEQKGYVPYDDSENIPFDWTKNGKRNYAKYYNTKTVGSSIKDENVYYLDQIVELCKENNIRTIFVTTTVSRMKICKVSNDDYFYDWYADYAKEHDIEYYDMNLLRDKDEKFSDVDCFIDLYHISNEGAPIFSTALGDMIRRIDEGEALESMFYASYAEYEATQDFSK